ncbi:MAG: CBS domain-containing protein [Catenulispora sp.]|nr:CBS domain-containing protein [Catenulispora sp.]
MRHRKVSSIMTPAAELVAVQADAPYKQIAALLAEHRISAVPVLDSEDRVVGVVSEADLLAKQSAMEPRRQPLLAGRRERQVSATKADATRADGLMTAPPVTVGLNEDVVHAARLMEKHHVKRLPVVDGAGRAAGIVSRRDILRLFLQSDVDIRQEVSQDVILGALWVDPTDLEIEVADGVVCLHGEVETRSLAELIGRLARHTDGVVDVDNRLTFARDDSDDKIPSGPFRGVFERRAG